MAVDTNVLVQAHREDSEWHRPAVARVAELARGRSSWAIPWPCIHELLAVVTHPRTFAPPMPPALAMDQADVCIALPSRAMRAESELHWRALRGKAVAGWIAGPPGHDAGIAALRVQHDVCELRSADRDLSRFSRVSAVSPLRGRSGRRQAQRLSGTLPPPDTTDAALRSRCGRAIRRRRCRRRRGRRRCTRPAPRHGPP